MTVKHPSSIKIGPIRYRVISKPHIYDPVRLGDDGQPLELLGDCHRDEGMIRLSGIQPRQVEQVTLMHELVHAILHDCGFYPQEEHHVDMLANHFVAMLHDNPKLVEYFRDHTR